MLGEVNFVGKLAVCQKCMDPHRRSLGWFFAGALFLVVIGLMVMA